jgi:hypothetical protein
VKKLTAPERAIDKHDELDSLETRDDAFVNLDEMAGLYEPPNETGRR